MDRSNGDMRKILNSLQSVSMAYSQINEDTVNICMGYPSRQIINYMTDSLVLDSFSDTYDKILKIKQENGLSISDVITELHNILINYILDGKSNIDSINKLSIDKVIYILDELRFVQYNQSVNTSESIQLGAIIGIFKN